MFIPNPILTVLTAVAYKAICDVVFEDEKDSPAFNKVMHDHDTLDTEILREVIREELREGEKHEG